MTPSIRRNRSAQSYALAASLALAACLCLNASAQVVNDPADQLIMTRPAVTPESAARSIVPAPAEEVDDKALKTAPAPIDELSPELDTAASDPIEALQEPLKARAVMVDINSDNLNYDKDRDVYIATGNAHLVVSEQNSELYADKITYDQNQDLVFAEGNVIIVKNGQKTFGSYAKIDLSRKSALINDSVTTVQAVRVKAKQSFVNDNDIRLEDGRLIISAVAFKQMVKNGGMSTAFSQNTGKGSQQARLARERSKRIYNNRNNMIDQMSYEQRLMYENAQAMEDTTLKDAFDDSAGQTSTFRLKAKDITVKRGQDGYDDIMMRRPSLYAGKFKLMSLPDTDFAYDEEAGMVQYLGPDIGSNRGMGGVYAGPGWDFHLGKGALRFSPIVSYGSPGFWSSNGKDGKEVESGPGVGAALHFRDPNTTVDLSYNTRVGSPIFFADRRITDNTHFQASVNDFYQQGLLGQKERPTYIAQLTDYRVLKEFKNFQLTSFESIGYAKDNFYPNYTETYFVENKGGDPQTLGRAQLQLQLQNVQPLLRVGKHVSFGARAQLITSAYTSGDFVGLARIGPTMSLNMFNHRLQTNMGLTLSRSVGESPFVFDSYYGGSQNFNMTNMFKVNKFLSLGTNSSFSLKRDNARGALAVGNSLLMMVGPTDVKATVGYDFITRRSFFGINYFPANKNTVVDFDQAHIIQPVNYGYATP